MDKGCQSGKLLCLSVNKGAEQPAGVWDPCGSNLMAAQEESVLGGNSITVGVKDSVVWHPKCREVTRVTEVTGFF